MNELGAPRTSARRGAITFFSEVHAGRVLLLAFAIFWTWTLVGSALNEDEHHSAHAASITLLPGSLLEPRAFAGFSTNGTDIYLFCGASEENAPTIDNIEKWNASTRTSSTISGAGPCEEDGESEGHAYFDTRANRHYYISGAKNPVGVGTLECSTNFGHLNLTSNLFSFSSGNSLFGPNGALRKGAITWTGHAAYIFGGINRTGGDCNSHADPGGFAFEWTFTNASPDSNPGCYADPPSCLTRIGAAGAPTEIAFMRPYKNMMAAAHDTISNVTYVFGGTDATSTRYAQIGKFWASNKTGINISATLPQATRGATAVYDSARRLIYIIGGDQVGGRTTDITVFNVTTETISDSGLDLGNGVYGLAAAYIPSLDRVYILGGNSSASPLATIYEMDPTGLGGTSGGSSSSAATVEAGKFEGHRYGVDLYGYYAAHACMKDFRIRGLNSHGPIRNDECYSDVLGGGLVRHIPGKIAVTADGEESTYLNFSIGSVNPAPCKDDGTTLHLWTPDGCSTRALNRTVTDWSVQAPDFVTKAVNVVSMNYTLHPTVSGQSCAANRTMNVTLGVTYLDGRFREYSLFNHNALGNFTCASANVSVAANDFDLLIDDATGTNGCFLPLANASISLDSRLANATLHPCESLSGVARLNVTFRSLNFDDVNVSLRELHVYTKGDAAFVPAHYAYMDYLHASQTGSFQQSVNTSLANGIELAGLPGRVSSSATIVHRVYLTVGVNNTLGGACSVRTGSSLASGVAIDTPPQCYYWPMIRVTAIGNDTAPTQDEVDEAIRIEFDGFTFARAGRMLMSYKVQSVGGQTVTLNVTYHATRASGDSSVPTYNFKTLTNFEQQLYPQKDLTISGPFSGTGIGRAVRYPGGSDTIFGFHYQGVCAEFDTCYAPEITAPISRAFDVSGFGGSKATFTAVTTATAGTNFTFSTNLTSNRFLYFGRSIYLVAAQDGLANPFRLSVAVNGRLAKPVATVGMSSTTTAGVWELFSRESPQIGVGFVDSGFSDLGNVQVNITLGVNGTLRVATQSRAGAIVACDATLKLCYGNVEQGSGSPLLINLRFEWSIGNRTGSAVSNAIVSMNTPCGVPGLSRTLLTTAAGTAIMRNVQRPDDTICATLTFNKPGFTPWVQRIDIPSDVTLVSIKVNVSAASIYEFTTRQTTIDGERAVLLTNTIRGASLGTAENPAFQVDDLANDLAATFGLSSEGGKLVMSILMGIVVLIIMIVLLRDAGGDMVSGIDARIYLIVFSGTMLGMHLLIGGNEGLTIIFGLLVAVLFASKIAPAFAARGEGG